MGEAIRGFKDSFRSGEATPPEKPPQPPESSEKPKSQGRSVGGFQISIAQNKAKRGTSELRVGDGLKLDEESRSVSHWNDLELHLRDALRLWLMPVNDEAAHRNPEGRTRDHVARKVRSVVHPVVGDETSSGISESRYQPSGRAGRDDRRESERFGRMPGRKRLI